MRVTDGNTLLVKTRSWKIDHVCVMSPEPTKLPCRMVIPSVVAERQELKKLISNAVHSDDVRALQVLELRTVRACWAEYLDGWVNFSGVFGQNAKGSDKSLEVLASDPRLRKQHPSVLRKMSILTGRNIPS